MDKIKYKDTKCETTLQLRGRLMNNSNAIHTPYRSMKHLKLAIKNGSDIMATVLWSSLRPID